MLGALAPRQVSTMAAKFLAIPTLCLMAWTAPAAQGQTAEEQAPAKSEPQKLETGKGNQADASQDEDGGAPKASQKVVVKQKRLNAFQMIPVNPPVLPPVQLVPRVLNPAVFRPLNRAAGFEQRRLTIHFVAGRDRSLLRLCIGTPEDHGKLVVQVDRHLQSQADEMLSPELNSDLSESQLKKLGLACRGDISRLMREIKAWQHLFGTQEAMRSVALRRQATVEVVELNARFHLCFESENSLYVKVLANMTARESPAGRR